MPPWNTAGELVEWWRYQTNPNYESPRAAEAYRRAIEAARARSASPPPRPPAPPPMYRVDYQRPGQPVHRTAPMTMQNAMDPNWAWHGPPSGPNGARVIQIRNVNQPPPVRLMPGVYGDPFNPMVQTIQRTAANPYVRGVANGVAQGAVYPFAAGAGYSLFDQYVAGPALEMSGLAAAFDPLVNPEREVYWQARQRAPQERAKFREQHKATLPNAAPPIQAPKQPDRYWNSSGGKK